MGNSVRCWASLIMIVCFGLASGARADETFANLGDKFTLINSTAAGVINQPLTGYWWWINSAAERQRGDAERDLYQLSVLGENRWVLLHSGADAQIDQAINPGDRHLLGDGVPGVLGQFKYDGSCFNGLIRTVERRVPNVQPKCPQYYWWTVTRMCVSQDYRAANLKTSGYKHDDDTCQHDRNKPTSLEVELERYLGASFAPVAAGKYIHLVLVTAPAQYVAEVKLAWDYRAFEAQNRQKAHRIVAALGTLSTGNQYGLVDTNDVSGAYVFPAEKPGRYHFVFKVYDIDGRQIHWDQLIADIPNVPGLN